MTLAGCSDEGAAPEPGSHDAGPDTPVIDPATYLDRSMREQVDAVAAGTLSATGLAAAYRARIDVRDRELHAVIAVAPETPPSGSGTLHGAAILVKDNIDTAGLATTAGSLAMKNNVPGADAKAIAKLRAASAVILGKTNLSEWANFRGNKSTSGWSSLGGQTNNGYDPAYNPCGSSAGSAAAVRAGMASAALGTETDGSIICPASVHGLVGFKPTVGLVSRAGVIPISRSQDTIGPITRTVGDAARLMTVLAGPDPNDPATSAIPSGLSLEFEAPLASASLAGKRFGVLDFRHNAAIKSLFAAERARLEKAGAVFVAVSMDLSFRSAEYVVMLHEFKFDLNGYLASHAREGQPATLEALIAFNEANKSTVMPYFGQEVFIEAQATMGLETTEYLNAKQAARDGAGKNGIDALLATHKLDALISPSFGPAWKTDYANGDRVGPGSSAPAAVAGYPHLTVPMGLVNELPVGLSIFAGAWDDAKVLALGYAYEQLPR